MIPIIVIALLGLLAGACAPWAARSAPRLAGWALSLAPAAVTLVVLHSATTSPGETTSLSLPWAPAIGLDLAFRMDGLAALFALLIAGVGTLVFIYATAYLHGHPRFGRFLASLMLFTIAMLGIVFSDNLLLLYVFWELTTVSSWLLIGFEHEQEEARRSAWQALMVTTAGGLAMLAGFVLLGQTAGTFEISAILADGQAVRDSAVYLPILALVLIGAAAKSALVPLHFWLPNAMVAPTPVSAYLHSAAMVKAGIYLIARMSPALSETAAWSTTVTALGALTAVVGAWMALMQSDLKRLLAYTTISALGMMTLALGIGGEHAVRAALALLFAHGLYKGGLFMVAGCIDHGAGGRDLTRLGGLARALPATAAASVLVMLSMVALPPTLGYISEESMLEAFQQEGGRFGLTAMAVFVAAAALYAGAGFIAGLKPFIGARRSPETPHDPSPGLWIPPLVLGAAGIVLALMAATLEEVLIAPATIAVAGGTPEEHLKLWHGVTTPFLLGWVISLVGVAIFAGWTPLRRAGSRLSFITQAGPDRIYRIGETALLRFADWINRWLQHGYLPTYLIIVVAVAVAVTAMPLRRAGVILPDVRVAAGVSDVAIVALMLMAAAGAIVCRSRIAVITCMSVVGYSIGIIFAIFGGPDIAMTQVLVETLLAVMVVLLLPAMPPFETLENRWRRLGDGVLCLIAGGLVTVLLLGVTAEPASFHIAEFYRANSETGGGGRNIVNTIIVNFRSLDTLGETSVLIAAAIGAAALMATASHRVMRNDAVDERSSTMPLESLLMTISARILMPLLMIFAAYLLLIGHAAPGGGFAAALVLAATLGLYLFGSPRSAERELLRLAPQSLLGIGLLVMLLSGAVALLSGDAFLTAHHTSWKLGILGGFHPSTALLFDIGVCLASAGGLFVMMRSIEERGPWRS